MTTSSEYRYLDLVRQNQAAISGMSAAQRAAQLGYSSIEDQYIAVYDAAAQARMFIGRQPDATFAIGYVADGSNPPPAPTSPVVAPRQLAALIGWDGTFEDGRVKPGDFARVDVHVSETSGFTPDGSTVVGSLYAESAILISMDSVTHYVKLVTVNLGDVISTPTAQQSVLPEPAGQIAAGAIGVNELAALIVLAGRIVVGNPTGARFELNGAANEVVAYESDGTTQNIYIDGDTGDVIFSGVYKTAPDGEERLVIHDDVSNATVIRFFGAGDDINHGALFKIDANDVLTLHGFTMGTSPNTHRGEVIFDSRPGFGFAMLSYGAPQSWLGGMRSLAFVNMTQINIQGPTVEIFCTKQYAGDTGTFGAGTRTVFGVKDASGNLITGSRIYFEERSNEPWIRFPANDTSLIAGASNKIYVRDATTGGTDRTLRGIIENTSSRKAKKDFKELDFDPLQAVLDAPVTKWKFKGGNDNVHIGPVAEDLPDVVVRRDGEGEDAVDVGSMIGLAMAAIQKLNEKVEQLSSRVAELERS